MRVVKLPLPRSYKEYSLSEIARIRELADQKKTHEEIAHTMNRTIGSISMFCAKHKIKVHVNKGKKILQYYSSIEEDRVQKLATKALDKPTSMQLAASVLLGDLKITNSQILLKINGRFMPSNLNEVMRATNKLLKRQGMDQILNNPAWVVS